ncbi:MAG: GHMP kinase [Acidobacteria bacterium RIFCSPLOWO2_12_FULL_66_10]|nr:MAG: GHMP kinase [Acidobacteria bacterium RIFCSPLOWO2_12_FULL_66_10]
MIITRTPFRISFAGGGTDLRAFYVAERGVVLASAIDKYIYITVNRRFDRSIRVSYSRTEIVEHASRIEHPIVREALALLGMGHGLEIISMADVPAQTGLGSSGSFTVGLLHALHAFRGEHPSAEQLAAEACAIEIERLREPIGKQDQYIAAYGGFQRIQFNADERVFVDPLICAPGTMQALNDRLLLCFTGMTRSASEILAEQQRDMGATAPQLSALAEVAERMRTALIGTPRLDAFGELLHESWIVKRRLSGVTNGAIDRWYDRARQAGAIGGKILGAGGGGFLLLFVEPDARDAVTRALVPLEPLPFQFEPQGSKVIYSG